jgi:SOS-response transcriptional repressor LexA
VIASVKAGYDGTAIEDCEGEMEVIPKQLLKGYNENDCRIFIAKGDSMYPTILNGDRLVVHVQPTVDNGEIAIVIYNGDEGTVKKVRHGKNYFEMIPINPEYQTKRIEGVDLEQCHIFGKVISLWRDF